MQDYIWLLWLEKIKEGNRYDVPFLCVLLKHQTSCFYILMSILAQVVLSCIEGGPADRAGIREGDELIEIDSKFKIEQFPFSFPPYF